MYSPIVVFAFNRLVSLKNTISSILKNPEAANSDLFVFVDGARVEKNGELDKVLEVRKYVCDIKGFKNVFYRFSDTNKGLACSIISGVTEIVNKFGRVIVIEDDLIVSQSFLQFMNLMLDYYEKDKRVMQVSGYGCKISRVKNNVEDYYLNKRAQSWTWATWKDRWDTVDWSVTDFDTLSNSKKLQREFNKNGSDLFGMLKGWKEKKNNSWYIRFNYSMHKQGRFAITPTRSLVKNDGFNVEATHCNVYNRFRIDFDNSKHEWNFIQSLSWDEKINKEAVKYWSYQYRIWGKVMTLFLKWINWFSFK